MRWHRCRCSRVQDGRALPLCILGSPPAKSFMCLKLFCIVESVQKLALVRWVTVMVVGSRCRLQMTSQRILSSGAIQASSQDTINGIIVRTRRPIRFAYRKTLGSFLPSIQGHVTEPGMNAHHGFTRRFNGNMQNVIYFSLNYIWSTCSYLLRIRQIVYYISSFRSSQLLSPKLRFKSHLNDVAVHTLFFAIRLALLGVHCHIV